MFRQLLRPGMRERHGSVRRDHMRRRKWGRVCCRCNTGVSSVEESSTLVILQKNAIRNHNMSTSSSPWEVDIDALVADRQVFSEFVYTPVKEAVEELKRRREDKKLGDTISEFLRGDIPSVLAGPFIKAVLFRQ